MNLEQNASNSCQACGATTAMVVEVEDNSNQPYILCADCHHRLLMVSLRPREWYNLAVKHGWMRYHLHDDFYDEAGNAGQPEEPVIDAELHPIPSLNEVVAVPELLLDYALTRWSLREDVVEALRTHPRPILLGHLSARIHEASSPDIRATFYEICGRVLGPDAADLVRAGWDRDKHVTLGALAYALAHCLPVEEGFPKVADEIALMPERERWYCLTLLSHFETPLALDWIEQNIGEFHDNYGILAASSQVNWPRAKQWLAGGRPLSLVALDALKNLASYNTRLLELQKPRLLDPPNTAELKAVLESYRERDKVLRTERRVASILARANELVAGQGN